MPRARPIRTALSAVMDPAAVDDLVDARGGTPIVLADPELVEDLRQMLSRMNRIGGHIRNSKNNVW